MGNPTLGRNAGRAVSALESMPQRAKFRLWPSALFAASFVVAWVPVVGGGLSHVLDRMKNRSDANYELGVRAKYYANEIGTTLGMDPSRVGRGDLVRAAGINPSLRRVVKEVEEHKGNENRSSLLINGGVTAAGFIPGAGGVAKIAGEGVNAIRAGSKGVQAAKQIAGSLAGGAVAGVLAKDELKSQELMEATEMDIHRARANGLNARAAINPQITFMIRLSQDEALLGEVNKVSKQRFGQKFHKLDSQQMGMIMNQYPDLANATLRESHAIANGDMDIRTLAGTAPNMSGGFAGPMARSDNAQGSFVQREQARRAAGAQQQGITA